MTKKKPDFLRDLDTAIMDELTGGGIKENAAGLVGTLTQIEEIKQLCGLPFCGYMAKLETVRPSGVPDEVTVVFAEDVPYRACNGIEFDIMQEFVESSRLAIQLSLVMTNMSFTERERACGNAIFFSANRLQYASNATKLSVSTQLFDRALLNRNGVMDIWNMAHVEDGEKYYIRKEYTEVSELHKGSEQPVIIQQVQQQTEPAAGEEPQNGQEEKEGVNNAS